MTFLLMLFTEESDSKMETTYVLTDYWKSLLLNWYKLRLTENGDVENDEIADEQYVPCVSVGRLINVLRDASLQHNNLMY